VEPVAIGDPDKHGTALREPSPGGCKPFHGVSAHRHERTGQGDLSCIQL